MGEGVEFSFTESSVSDVFFSCDYEISFKLRNFKNICDNWLRLISSFFLMYLRVKIIQTSSLESLLVIKRSLHIHPTLLHFHSNSVMKIHSTAFLVSKNFIQSAYCFLLKQTRQPNCCDVSLAVTNWRLFVEQPPPSLLEKCKYFINNFSSLQLLNNNNFLPLFLFRDAINKTAPYGFKKWEMKWGKIFLKGHVKLSINIMRLRIASRDLRGNIIQYIKTIWNTCFAYY